MSVEWLMLGGCPRSGTTLLVNLLNSSDGLYLSNEQNIKKVIGKLEEVFYREKSVKSIMDREKGKKENWRKEDVLKHTFKAEKSLTPLLEQLYLSNYNLSKDQNLLLGDKLPMYWRENWEEISQFLNLKTIHVSRHPYDVLNSYFRRSKKTKEGKDYWKKEASVEAVMSDWVESWNFILGKNKDPNYLHIKYEDLIFDTSSTKRKMEDFLNRKLNWDESWIVKDYHHERECISSSELAQIDTILGEVSSDWNKSLEVLEAHGKIEFSTGKRANSKAFKLNNDSDKGSVVKGKKTMKQKFKDKLKTIVRSVAKEEIEKKLNAGSEWGRPERHTIMKIIYDFVVRNEITGDYAEFGVFEGRSATFAMKTVRKFQKQGKLLDTKIFLFDSFQGLPELDSSDVKNDYNAFAHRDYACTRDVVEINLRKSIGTKLDNVVFVEGFYDETLSSKKDYGLKKIAVCHIDCDLYSSTVPVLDFIYDKLQDGTIIAFDDFYCYRGNPRYGVQRAFIEWVEKNDVKYSEFYRYSWAGQSFIIHR